MAMRPFWLSADVEGRKSGVGTGPRAKVGRMDVDVAANVDGCSHRFVSVHCFTDYNNKLHAHIDVKYSENKNVRLHWTEDDGRADDGKITEVEQLIRQFAGHAVRMEEQSQEQYLDEAATLMVEVLKAANRRFSPEVAAELLGEVCKRYRG